MEAILYAPPIVFALFLVIFMIVIRRLARYSAREDNSERALAPYACGQRDFEHYVNPDYMQFFRYAFVFTVMHVLALVITTAPSGALALPLAYVGAGVLALAIIFRK